LTDPGEARLFLEGREEHDPAGFEGMADAVAQVRSAVAGGRRVTVYGDFDVDGVSATTILVTALRQLKADCDWFIPDRISDGYGLNPDAISELAARGTGLVVSVDCGVTSVGEVALARELGMGIIVTDHHRPEAVLPDCTILHPEVSGYPFKELCGAAVAAKFATALRRDADLDPSLDEADLDLVALATVADVMPLVGENRRLVRKGVKVARRAQRPGMKALMADARLEPARLTATDFGFRLGPRINAAGRIYRADAGVELFLAGSAERAGEIASELGRANNERRRIEREVETAAEAARRELGEESPAVLVVAGEGWHPGVVGIVASRLVRSHGVPAVVIAVDGSSARGSARGVPGLDLHAAIGSTADLLEGFGGHAAAAGLQIKPERIDEFRAALGRAVVEQLGTEPAVVPEPVDAIAGGEELALALAEEIEVLEPCGKGNPSVSLLVPDARITDLREMGEGRHCRFSVVSGRARAAGISFGRTGFGVDEDTPVDVLAELSVNHWKGSSQPQLRVTAVAPSRSADGDSPEPSLPGCEEDEWLRRFEAAIGRQVQGDRHSANGNGNLNGAASAPNRMAEAVRPPGRSPSISALEGPAEVVLMDLASSGEPLLVVTADARRRWRSLGGEAGLGRLRFAAGAPVTGLWDGSPAAEVERFERNLPGGLCLTDHSTLGAHRSLVGACPNTVVFDPPASTPELERVLAGEFVCRLSDPAGVEFAELASADRHALTPRLRAVYRGLREAGEATGETLRQILSGLRPLPDTDPDLGLACSPERSAALLGILVEAGVARSEGSGDARTVSIVSSEKVDLADSTLFCEQQRIHKEQVAFLRQSNR
jgi:single-stranded-DNA-specific exonuclease